MEIVIAFEECEDKRVCVWLGPSIMVRSQTGNKTAAMEVQTGGVVTFALISGRRSPTTQSASMPFKRVNRWSLREDVGSVVSRIDVLDNDRVSGELGSKPVTLHRE